MSSLPKSPAEDPENGNGSRPERMNAPGAQSDEHFADPSSVGGPPPAGATQPPVRGGERNPLALVVVALIVAGMLYFGFHMARRPGPEAPAVLSKTTPAPDFTLESLEGKNMRLSDFHGKAVLLNFWATWCGPCKIEMPWFVDFQKEYGPQGLQIVGVAMDDSSKEDIAKFAKDMGVNYPVLLGKEAVGDEYGGVPALPESFFIGRNGKIVDKIIGLKGKAEIEDSIKKALDTSASSGSTTASAAQPQK
jgi:thiol-disulfide isomerase/thioredoxin